MHRLRVNGQVKVLESYLAPTDFTIGELAVRKGTWLLAVRVLSDELWERVKSGDLTGFSIGGSARRVPEPAPVPTSEQPPNDTITNELGGRRMTTEMNKADGVHRLVDMVVEEVSLVDRAANKHRFLIVKRDDAMDDDNTTDTTTGRAVAARCAHGEARRQLGAQRRPRCAREPDRARRAARLARRRPGRRSARRARRGAAQRRRCSSSSARTPMA
jgi:hypothetical protein